MLSFGRRCVAVWGALVLALVAPIVHAADAPPLPFVGGEGHLGVASCGGSSCHGALQPWPGSTVLQNEFIVWQEKDRHAKAYRTLLSEKSKRIATNLGLPSAAEAKICLDCHADNVTPDRRAKGFEISDGVGCESCHGGAVKWLGLHVDGKSNHAANVAAGLYPTEDPVARARLCLSCHFGDENRFITHRIMGAGHPRLAFELDTFTVTQPAHFRVDGDYRQRKAVADGVKTWAIGQALAVESLLDAMLDPRRNPNGLFPELVFFDCHACHHPMSNVRWEPRDSHGVGPGNPRINDANLLMLVVYLDQVNPNVAKQFRDRSRALHQAAQKGHEATLEAARTLKSTVAGLPTQIAAAPMGSAEMRRLLVGVIAQGVKGEYVDYAAAEQATMAMSAILDAMKGAGALSQAQYDQLQVGLEKCYEAVEKDEAYNPRQFLQALSALEATVPRS
jgi:hypothetical protein